MPQLLPRRRIRPIRERILPAEPCGAGRLERGNFYVSQGIEVCCFCGALRIVHREQRSEKVPQLRRKHKKRPPVRQH